MASAERISRIDLGGEELTNNLAYFATVRGMENPAQRAAALAPEELPVMAEPRHTRKSRSVRNSAAPATGGTAVPEPFPAAPAPPPASQPRPLAPILGEAGGPGDGLGAWFVDVGRFDGPAAAERWRRLRLKHAADLAGMERLAGAGSGEEPLLIGAVDSEQAAAKLCGQLGRDVGTCQPMRL
jgi:hypothetical protein